jgi:hypothetical protein
MSASGSFSTKSAQFGDGHFGFESGHLPLPVDLYRSEHRSVIADAKKAVVFGRAIGPTTLLPYSYIFT